MRNSERCGHGICKGAIPLFVTLLFKHGSVKHINLAFALHPRATGEKKRGEGGSSNHSHRSTFQIPPVDLAFIGVINGFKSKGVSMVIFNQRIS
jgi:hypothetical protein